MLTEQQFQKEYSPYIRCKELSSLKPALLVKLELLSKELNEPLVVTSGYRPTLKNLAVGGSKNSAHLTGSAVDVRCHTSHDRYRYLQAAFKVGFKRIGVGPTYIHLDIAPIHTHPQNVLWYAS